MELTNPAGSAGTCARAAVPETQISALYAQVPPINLSICRLEMTCLAGPSKEPPSLFNAKPPAETKP
jgi:hypothetical protein